MVDEEILKPIREMLEQVRDRLDTAVTRLKSIEEVRCMRWRCAKCGFTIHYTRPMPEHVVDPCPKCRSTKFVPVA
jgi:rubrerythrin